MAFLYFLDAFSETSNAFSAWSHLCFSKSKCVGALDVGWEKMCLSETRTHWPLVEGCRAKRVFGYPEAPMKEPFPRNTNPSPGSQRGSRAVPNIRRPASWSPHGRCLQWCCSPRFPPVLGVRRGSCARSQIYERTPTVEPKATEIGADCFAVPFDSRGGAKNLFRCSAFATGVTACAVNVRHLFHRRTLRAAILAGRGGARAHRMRALLAFRGRHFRCT